MKEKKKRFQKILKEKKGITLVALVITIVILIILATIAIQFAFGNNGLIKRASDAKEFYANDIEYTDKSLTNTESYINDLLNNNNNEIDITINVTGEDASVIADGTIIKEVKFENVPIPNGFYYAGGDKNTGIVISDIEGDDLDNSKSGNQFVWIPVQVNQNIEIEVKSKEKLQKVFINGKEEQVEGNTFKKTINKPRNNGLYIVEAIDMNGNKNKVSKEIRTLYGQDFSIPWKYPNVKEYNTLEEMVKGENSDSVKVEDFLKFLEFMGQTLEEYCLERGVAVKEEGININRDELILYWQEEYANRYKLSDETIDSVEKYGGFYIGRFEAGTDNNRTSQDDELTPVVVKKDKYPYTYVWGTQAKSLADSMYDTESVKSCLITGCAWDKTINYISQLNGKGYDWAYSSSDEYGNLATGKRTKTGEYSKDNYYNIYDLSGNVFEWSAGEIYDSEYYSVRGGTYISTNFEYAAYRIYGERSEDYIGFRVQLYLK